MKEKNRVIVKINGQDYPIVGAEPKEYLLRVGSFVDEQMERITKHNSKLSISMIAVLTCINIADQLLKLQDKMISIKKQHIDPLKELEEIKTQHELALQKLEDKTEGFKLLQNQLEDLIDGKRKTDKENARLKTELRNKEKDIINAEEIINDLQNKLFENQIKLVQMRKDLDKYVKATEDT